MHQISIWNKYAGDTVSLKVPYKWMNFFFNTIGKWSNLAFYYWGLKADDGAVLFM